MGLKSFGRESQPSVTSCRGIALPRDWEEQLKAARVSEKRLERVVDRLDGLAERWHALSVGEQMTLEWPRAERR